MKPFGELLSDYINQTGVSDAELARRLGVSRQTVFRWREGLTQRPRHREDVLRMAEMLRLSPAERDQLLLAGGFRPDQPPAAVVQPGGEGQPATPPSLPTGPPATAGRAARPGPVDWVKQAVRQRPVVVGLGVAGLLVLGLSLLTGYPAGLRRALGLAGPSPETSLRPAAPGETLVLISPFINYSEGQAGYNVAGRIREALELEFAQAGLAGVRVEVPATSVTDEAAALALGEALGAALVVWGEFDSGRVVAVVTASGREAPPESEQRRWLLASPGELSATINSELPDEVRWMALTILGQSRFQAGELAAAAAAFTRALAIPPQDPAGQAQVYYYLALTEGSVPGPDHSRVIALYSEALDLRPGFGAALNNRAVAYLQRGSPGDRERAESDLRQVLRLDPEEPSGPFNLALVLAPQGPGPLEEALALLEQAQALRPDSPGVLNGLCWYGALAGDPQGALPHCDQAVGLDRSGLSHDSRGLALALLGRYAEAASEFEDALARLQAQDPAAYDRLAPSRLDWIEALRAGRNPFDQATLSALLGE